MWPSGVKLVPRGELCSQGVNLSPGNAGKTTCLPLPRFSKHSGGERKAEHFS
jgi:hypothetical protein